MAGKTWIPVVAIAVLGACTKSTATSDAADSSAAVASRPCDPLSVNAEPIALGELVGAGRAADGTVYVLDRGPSGASSRGLRAFVSEGTILRRRKVFGSGEGPDFVTVSLDASSEPLQVRVELAGASATRMGIFRGPLDPKTKSFEIGVSGEELTLLSSTALASFELANIAGVEVLYAATTDDGHRFYAFEPTIDLREGTTRVFYGTVDEIIERRVLSESRDLTVHLEIDLDGVRTRVQLNFCYLNPAFGPSRLQPADAPGLSGTLLTPIPGSPGGVQCTGGLGDAGADPSPLPDKPAEASTLVAGVSFLCF